MANKFLGFFNREDSETKSLKQTVQALRGEQEDMSAWDAKFYDAEPSSFSGNGMYQVAGIDQTVNSEQLQRLYCTETWVYVAINAIAKTIAGLPFQLQKRTKTSKKVTNMVTGSEDVVELDSWVDSSGSKLYDRFAYPNKFITRAEFFMLLVVDLLSAGEYYVYLDSDQDLTTITSADDIQSDDPKTPFGRLRQIMASGADTPIKGLYRIPPSLMKPVPSEDNLSIEGYALHAAAGAYAYSAAEIIHVKLPNPTAPMQGLSPLIPALKPVLLDRFSTEHMIRFYKSGARLGGVIQSSKDMTKEQLGRFQRSYENNYTGRQNHHRTLILPPGMDYKQIEQNPAETALIEFCKYNREAILAVYNVPPIKAGIMDNANYANALVQLRQFFTDTIMPTLVFIEDGFNLKNTMMPDSRNFRFKFDLSQVEALKENFKDKAEAAKFMMDGGMTVNEVRAQVWQLGPIKDGDKCKVVENIKAGKTNEGGSLFLAAPQEGVDNKEDVPERGPDQGLLAGMPGPMVTQIMNILGRVSRGRLSPEAALEMMHTIHSVPKDTAYRLLGMKPPIPEQTMDQNLMPSKDAVSGQPQPDQASINSSIVSTTGTLSERVAELTALYMQRDKLTAEQARARAMERALTEGYGKEDKDGVSAPAFIPTDVAHDPGHPKKPEEKCETCKKDPCECPDKGGPGSGRHSSGRTSRESLDRAHAAVEHAAQLTEQFSQRMQAIDADPSNLGLRDGIEKLRNEMNAAHREAHNAMAEARDNKPKAAEKPTLEQFITDALGKLNPDEPVTPEFIEELKALYAQTHGEVVAVENKEAEIGQRQVYSFGWTKETVAQNWKSFIEKTDPMIVKRHAELVKFFASVKAIVMGKLGANVKAYGLMRRRTKADGDDIMSGPEYDALIKKYIDEVDAALKEAAEYGFADTLVSFKFDLPDEKALAALKQCAGDKIKGIMETTKDQIREVLADGFEKEKPIAEISGDITAKFAEIDTGRAQTIARTETLTAVSMGRELKRQEWQAEFPEQKLMKMWVSAQDDRVRDSHDALDGVSIPADETFDNGCLYPRDPNGDASEVISCRCTDITHAEEDTQQVQDSLKPDDEGEPEGESDDSEKSFTGTGGKGGPGSGRHAGPPKEPYDRPKTKPLATSNLTGGQRNNFADHPTHSQNERLMDTKGKDITKSDTSDFQGIAEQERASSFGPALERTAESMKSENVPIVSMKSRAKDAESLQTKMNDKWSDKSLNQVTDGIGGRIVAADQHGADMAAAKFVRLSGMTVLEHNDYAEKDKNGYRAIHYVVRTPGGMMAEMQIKTQNQDTWASWSHDALYKGAHAEDKEAQTYAKAVSDHLSLLDRHQPAGDRPEAPESVKQAGLEFPWNKVRA